MTDEANKRARELAIRSAKVSAGPEALAALEHLFFIIERLDKTQGSETDESRNVTVTLGTWKRLVSPAVAVVRRALDDSLNEALRPPEVSDE